METRTFSRSKKNEPSIIWSTKTWSRMRSSSLHLTLSLILLPRASMAEWDSPSEGCQGPQWLRRKTRSRTRESQQRETTHRAQARRSPDAHGVPKEEGRTFTVQCQLHVPVHERGRNLGL